MQSNRNQARGRCLMVFTSLVLIFWCECECPKLFADSAKILGVSFLFGLFYLQYPQAICGFCIRSGILTVRQKYTSMFFASNAKWFQIEVGKHIFDKNTKKTMERNWGRGFYSSSWRSVEPTSSVCSEVQAAAS